MVKYKKRWKKARTLGNGKPLDGEPCYCMDLDRVKDCLKVADACQEIVKQKMNL